MKTFEEFGLKDDWNSVEHTLTQVIPVYDKTNHYISFGSDLRLRKIGTDILRGAMGNKSQFTVVDLGSGLGKMTEILSQPSLMIDALPQMMKIASDRNPESQGVVAVFENLPLREESYDSVMSGFAIRDSRNLARALSEVNYILRENGFYLIVDLSKPDSKLKRAIVALYWRIFAPLISYFVAGRLGLKFAALYMTFDKLPTSSEFANVAKDAGFEINMSRYFMLNGSCVLLLRKISRT